MRQCIRVLRTQSGRSSVISHDQARSIQTFEHKYRRWLLDGPWPSRVACHFGFTETMAYPFDSLPTPSLIPSIFCERIDPTEIA